MDEECFQHIVESMSQRIKTVLKAKERLAVTHEVAGEYMQCLSNFLVFCVYFLQFCQTWSFRSLK